MDNYSVYTSALAKFTILSFMLCKSEMLIEQNIFYVNFFSFLHHEVANGAGFLVREQGDIYHPTHLRQLVRCCSKIQYSIVR